MIRSTAEADVIVVGAGPAGAALAIGAGRAGLKVLLLDAGQFPREKPCGEGIMPSGVRALSRLGLDDACGGARIDGVAYRGFGMNIVTNFPGDSVAEAPYGLGQRRLVLDQVLVDAARDTVGVTVFEKVRVDGLILRHGRVVGVEARDRVFHGRLTVGADGARSTVRRLLGLDAPATTTRWRRVGWRVHFRLPPGAACPTHVQVYIGHGYELYVTPLPGGCVLVAALALVRDGIADAGRALRRFIAEHSHLEQQLRGAAEISAPRGRSPLVYGARAAIAPGAVLLGDAAGNSDPITGGGVSQALLSAELLVAALPRSQFLSDAPYDGEWLYRFDRRRRALLRDYRWLTAGLARIARSRGLTRATLSSLRSHPRVMQHLVGVAAGLRTLI